MAPEQVRGSSAVDPRSDLYSLGVTLYEVVTGSRPFQGETDYEVYSAHLNKVPSPPREKNPAIPPELSDIILKSLAKDPAKRFQTAEEFRAALENPGALPQEATATIPVASPEKPRSAATGPATSPSRAAARTATGQSGSTASLEMAYVLFMDIVAYSTLPMDRQSERIQQLVEIVRNTQEYQQAQAKDQLISLPTGDGMALVFFQNPTAPVQCASEISRAIHLNPEIKLRMGVHTGPVYRIPDINTNLNVAGGGINMAQRVMDCGDAGHILVSKNVADVLGQLSDWANTLHDLGEAEVKHGVKVHIVNFVSGDVGNPELPQKLRKALAPKAAEKAPAAVATPAAGGKKTYWIAAAGIVAAILIAVGVTQFSHRGEAPAEGNRTTPGAQSPSQPSAPIPPPPSGTSSAVPPASPPPPAPSTAASPVQATPAAATNKQSGIRREAVQQPVAAVPQRAAEPPPPAPPAASASAALGSAEKVQLQELRERMILLAGRAAAVRGSVENLERQQNRSGLSLRGDMAAAKESMEYLMGEAKAALGSSDAATTKRNLDLAEQQVEKLEHFLGR
jgi:class 3 adenylate cyclase